MFARPYRGMGQDPRIQKQLSAKVQDSFQARTIRNSKIVRPVILGAIDITATYNVVDSVNSATVYADTSGPIFREEDSSGNLLYERLLWALFSEPIKQDGLGIFLLYDLLALAVTSNGPDPISNSINWDLRAHRVKVGWNPSTLTYATQPAYDITQYVNLRQNERVTLAPGGDEYSEIFVDSLDPAARTHCIKPIGSGSDDILGLRISIARTFGSPIAARVEYDGVNNMGVYKTA